MLPDAEAAAAPIEALFEKFGTGQQGLSGEEVQERLRKNGHNELARKKKRSLALQFTSHLLNPLILVMIFIALVSLDIHEDLSALVVATMAAISTILSFVQEYHAGKEAEKLREMIQVKVTAIRGGQKTEVPIRDIVPGDIIDLYAGDVISADLRIFSCKDLFINQSSLTGESFPVEKSGAPAEPKGAAPAELTNIAFMGSSVESGTGYGLAIRTGVSTRFGEISRKLAAARTETSFDRGIRSFTWLMIRLIALLVAVIFAINAALKGNLFEALLFSLAVAVGLTPEMLPMIITLNLSKGAMSMAKKQVIIKRLNSIQNLGAMDVLCMDKTGTLTMNTIVLEKHLDVLGNEDEEVLKLGYINSAYQTGLKNLLDAAILKHENLAVAQYRKIDEIPFDFSRKVMSVIVSNNGTCRMITKGAPEEIFKRCSHYDLKGKIKPVEARIIEELKKEYGTLSSEGFRVLAIAYRDLEEKASYSKDDEQQLVLKGYLAFLDPPKPTAKEAIRNMQKLGIELKILTGDNELVTRKICGEVGIEIKSVMKEEELEKTDDELKEAVERANIFVMLSPSQKERIIKALQKNNHTVGYLGDGINDAPSLKKADVGISVDNAVDIARESADIILLRKSLGVLEEGVREGRKTFGNITKYINMGASSNFGNMISMTGASIFLPFLPMAPIQILVNNFLYDVSQIAIPTDEVDEEYLQKPRAWNVQSIKKFMLMMGPISTIFDFLTFGVLFFAFGAQEGLFHTGWFLESLLTQTLVIHVIRTSKVPFAESRASRALTATTLLIMAAGLALPFTQVGASLGFVRPPPAYFPVLAAIVGLYLITEQAVKSWFIKKYGLY